MLTRLTTALVFCTAAAAAQAQTQDWEKQWNAWVAGAKQEGKVFSECDDLDEIVTDEGVNRRIGVAHQVIGDRHQRRQLFVRRDDRAERLLALRDRL